MANRFAEKLPTPDEVELAEQGSRALARFSNKPLRLKVFDEDSGGEDLILPNYALKLLLDILTEMSKGNAVSIMPVHAELTTQDAANLLNVSRPYLINLLKENVIPYRKVGTHRRILAKHIFEYKTQEDEKRLKTLKDLASQAQELNLGYE